MTPLESISASLNVVISKYKDVASDGKVTLQEVLQLTITGAMETVRLTQTLPVSGVIKKQTAMEAVSKFIDEVITPLDLPGVPNLIEPVVDQGIKSLLMLAADAAIDSAVALFNQIGWPGQTTITDHFADV